MGITAPWKVQLILCAWVFLTPGYFTNYSWGVILRTSKIHSDAKAKKVTCSSPSSGATQWAVARPRNPSVQSFISTTVSHRFNFKEDPVEVCRRTQLVESLQRCAYPERIVEHSPELSNVGEPCSGLQVYYYSWLYWKYSFTVVRPLMNVGWFLYFLATDAHGNQALVRLRNEPTSYDGATKQRQDLAAEQRLSVPKSLQNLFYKPQRFGSATKTGNSNIQGANKLCVLDEWDIPNSVADVSDLAIPIYKMPVFIKSIAIMAWVFRSAAAVLADLNGQNVHVAGYHPGTLWVTKDGRVVLADWEDISTHENRKDLGNQNHGLENLYSSQYTGQTKVLSYLLSLTFCNIDHDEVIRAAGMRWTPSSPLRRPTCYNGSDSMKELITMLWECDLEGADYAFTQTRAAMQKMIEEYGECIDTVN